jgi:3-phosphoshikimate 1-carboxyvinyltransferase
VGDLVVRGGRPLEGVRIDGARTADLSDELPMLAVVMAAATGPSEVRDAGELRVKESDRVALVEAGLRAIGVDAEELPDGWRVTPRADRPRPVEALIETRGDHRIAMAFAIAAATGVAEGVVIDDPACASVSYATFWSDLATVTGSPMPTADALAATR